ncbi:MAG TPA: hypothetical protein VMU61_00010 [Candidatus Aquilonibacter sp.]|nr:hypothetical protein [Candidatus Aquilonibacter sp.]
MREFRSVLALAVLAVLVLGTETASAQRQWTTQGSKSVIGASGAPDLLKVNYFTNANTAGAQDGTVQIVNPGSPTGNLCAQIYVFDAYQELSECCGCPVTPGGLRTLSVNTDLTGNPLTGVKLATGSVLIVSGYTSPTFNTTCSPLNNIVSPTIRAWGTHLYLNGSSYQITESEYSDRSLGQWDDFLLTDCYALLLDGSGHGSCSCGTGD